MMKHPISIVSMASISPLGSGTDQIWKNYLNDDNFIGQKKIKDTTALVCELSKEGRAKISTLKNSDSKYKDLDDSVLFAIYSAREAVKKAKWKTTDNFGINIGSSRGATGLFEKYHQLFLKMNFAETLASPTTTLGNISSWVAHDLQTDGPEISHSITCSTALHSLLNGVAWIQSEMSDKFMVGGSEAPLTDFTIAQMRALKVYAKTSPCLALDLDKKQNTMVLGEGAAVICLEKGICQNAIAFIEGIGYATEVLTHNVSISTQANCFQKSMKMAMEKIDKDKIDAIVMHAPGTIKGDISEYEAIQKVFGNSMPFLTTNKWKLGHTFGASGMLSMELALLMLQKQHIIKVPFAKVQKEPEQLKNILVNAVGFGGNAVSVLVKVNPTKCDIVK